MADYSEKKIDNIRPGDEVAGDNGKCVVQDVLYGCEELLVVLETTGGRRLSLTENHPVKTDSGTVRANALTVGENIYTADGKEQIKYLHQEQYHEIVYNLILSPSDMMICNGVLVGDFAIQNMLERENEKSIEPDRLKEWRSAWQ